MVILGCKDCSNMLRVLTRETDVESFHSSELTEDDIDLTILNDGGSMSIIVNKNKLLEALK